MSLTGHIKRRYAMLPYGEKVFMIIVINIPLTLFIKSKLKSDAYYPPHNRIEHASI